MIDRSIPAKVIECFLRPQGVTSTQSIGGGLSGARVWRCRTTADESLCLRQWTPTHPTLERLKLMHAALLHATQHGLKFVPKLTTDVNGNSFVHCENCYWELTQWLPGNADYVSQPSRAKLIAAATALAELHTCWRGLSCNTGRSPTMLERAERLRQWLGQRDLVERLGTFIRNPDEGRMCLATIQNLQLVGPRLLARLERFSQDQVTLQPVVRDVWSDHLLFDGERLVGIVDYGALRIDEVAVDLARMLGSLEPFDASARRAALETYNRQAAEQPVDLTRVELLDECSGVLTALQWMQWLVQERRTFALPVAALYQRWQTAISRC